MAQWCNSHTVKCDTLGKTVAGPKLRKSIPLARLEVRKSIPLRAAHPQVSLLWKNPRAFVTLSSFLPVLYYSEDT